MDKRLMRYSMIVSMVLAAGIVTPAAVAKEKFTLVTAVPDDVFLVVAGRHNPERVFLDQYWAEVFDALKQSGVGADLMAMIGAKLGTEELAEIDRFKELATRLLEGVNWEALGAGEIVFAERMTGMIQVGDDTSMMPPDMVWMFRGEEGSAAKNYAGLVAILQNIIGEVNKAAGEEAVKVDTTPRGEVQVAGVNLLATVPQAPPLGLSVALRGDVIVIGFGQSILTEVLDLMDGKGAKKALATTPRFKDAFAKLPEAEDQMVFFDVPAMIKPIRAIADVAVGEMKPDSGDAIKNAGFNQEAEALADQGVGAYQQDDYAKAVALTQKAHEIAPTDSRIMYNLACFHALSGHKDEALTWLGKAVEGGFYAPEQIAGDSDLTVVRDDPRYKTALEKAVKMAAAANEGDAWASSVKQLVARLFDVPGMIDYVAAVEYTEGYAVHGEDITALVPGADQKPFYPVFAKRKPLAEFDRYLPEETASFSVCNGIDLGELYRFAEETIKGLGPKGQEMLTQWAGIQQQFGVDVKKDILGWIEGTTISATLQQPSGKGEVFMLKVSDEAIAREKLAAGLAFATAGMQKLAQQNPMLAMLAIRTAPATHEKLTGFQSVYVGMQPQPMVCGVAQGYLILASSADAVATCLATAAGEHPNIRKNSRLMAEAMMPKGPFQSVSFTDQRNMGAELAQVTAVLSMGGGMAAMAIPDPEAQQMLTKVLGIVAKLSPVAQKINFYKSSADYVTFDGKAWHTRSVTNYQSPAERTASGG